MTTVTILGEAQGVEPKKKIEFVKCVDSTGLSTATCDPKDYANIEIIARNTPMGFDSMLAYDDDRNRGILYLGHFNDGIV